MNYYPFHLGDYAAHTGHLDPLEDIAYRRLLDLYYLREAPLPAGDDLARLIRMRGHEDVVARVLGEFFERDGAVWRHARCDAEIGKYRAMVEGSRKGAEARWKKGGDSPPMPGACPGDARGNASPMPTRTRTRTNTNTSPTSTDVEVGGGAGGGDAATDPPNPPAAPEPPPEKPKRSAPQAAPKLPDGVDEQTWADFLALRKAKKAPVTETVLKRARSEADKARMPLAQFLSVWCARGSQGLEAAWLTPEERRGAGPAQPVESFRERDERLARERWQDMAGRRIKPVTADVIDMPPSGGQRELLG